jgi:prolyl-tRNA synthetase
MVPIFKTEEEHTQLLERMYELKKELEAAGLSVKVDDRDNLRPGFKFAEWELKGVPARIVIGPRDLAAGVVELARRDNLNKESVPQEGLAERLLALMDDIQENIYAKALKFREENTFKVDSWDEFKEKIEEGGFLLCHWDGTAETEAKIKDETKATVRCIPLDSFVCKEEGKCIYSGKPSHERVLFARAY